MRSAASCFFLELANSVVGVALSAFSPNSHKCEKTNVQPPTIDASDLQAPKALWHEDTRGQRGQQQGDFRGGPPQQQYYANGRPVGPVSQAALRMLNHSLPGQGHGPSQTVNHELDWIFPDSKCSAYQSIISQTGTTMKVEVTTVWFGRTDEQCCLGRPTRRRGNLMHSHLA